LNGEGSASREVQGKKKNNVSRYSFRVLRLAKVKKLGTGGLKDFKTKRLQDKSKKTIHHSFL